MHYYTIALFFHIVGALGFFASLGLEWLSLRQLRNATTVEQVREWGHLSTLVGRMAMASMGIILVFGFYLMAVASIGAAWLIVAFWLFVLLIILAAALTSPRLRAIKRATTGEHGPASPTLLRLLHHPLLWISIQTRLAIALGVVFLMTVKPGLSGALVTAGIAVALGLASALLLPSRARPQAMPAM